MPYEAGALHSMPGKILLLLDNLFFAGKILPAAAEAGREVVRARTASRALELARSERPAMIILDLDASECGPLELLRQLKADEELARIPTLGFVSHVNTGRQAEAREAGCDRVLARSAFDRDLRSLLTPPV
ncbi:MAG: response regulator [Blastocatellia bacterium]